LFRFNKIWRFSTNFHRSLQISNLTEIRPLGVALIHTDRRTNTMNVIGVFRDYANAPKIIIACSSKQWYYLSKYTASNPQSSQLNLSLCLSIEVPISAWGPKLSHHHTTQETLHFCLYRVLFSNTYSKTNCYCREARSYILFQL
jgi:hypothetical protein